MKRRCYDEDVDVEDEDVEDEEEKDEQTKYSLALLHFIILSLQLTLPQKTHV